MPASRFENLRSYPHIHRLYGTRAWKAIRSRQLAREPLCRMCRANGIETPASVCDHIEPHRGDEAKFWSGPFQSLCRDHHNASKKREEAYGFSTEIASDGWPVDPRHPANRQACGNHATLRVG